MKNFIASENCLLNLLMLKFSCIKNVAESSTNQIQFSHSTSIIFIHNSVVQTSSKLHHGMDYSIKSYHLQGSPYILAPFFWSSRLEKGANIHGGPCMSGFCQSQKSHLLSFILFQQDRRGLHQKGHWGYCDENEECEEKIPGNENGPGREINRIIQEVGKDTYISNFLVILRIAQHYLLS